MHRVTDHFPDDAQDVGDPEWMEYGLARGWSLLTQDERIRRQAAALALLRHHRGIAFCLSSAELRVAAKVDRFHDHQRAIHGHVRSGRFGFYVVYEHRIVRRWP